jgi:DHA1 family tetracycline resistance protein-like MFS transporter
MQLIGAPILGRLSDRFGRRPVLIISQIGTFIGFLILGLADMLWLLFLSRIIDGISGANISTAQAVITDSTTEKTRTQGLGLIGAAFGLGFIIGPIIAFISLYLSNNNYHVTAFVAAAFSLASILLTWFWLEETHPPEKRGRSTRELHVGFRAMFNALRRPQIGFLLSLMFAQQFAFGGLEQLLALFTLNRLGMNASNNAALFVYVGVIVVVVQGYFIGRWSRKLGDRWVVLMGLLVLGSGMILTALTPTQTLPGYSKKALTEELSNGANQSGESPPVQDIEIELPEDDNQGWLGIGWLLITMIPAAVGGGVLQPSINSMITKKVRTEDVGGILGISASFFSGANAITPLVLGAIFELLGSTAPFMIGGVILVALWFISSRKIPKL